MTARFVKSDPIDKSDRRALVRIAGVTEAAARQALVPVMCVAKQVGELDTFANLAEEAARMGTHWDVVLVSTLGGSAGQLPASDRVDAALQQMIGLIQAGDMNRFVAFDRSGDMLQHA